MLPSTHGLVLLCVHLPQHMPHLDQGPAALPDAWPPAPPSGVSASSIGVHAAILFPREYQLVGLFLRCSFLRQHVSLTALQVLS